MEPATATADFESQPGNPCCDVCPVVWAFDAVTDEPRRLSVANICQWEGHLGGSLRYLATTSFFLAKVVPSHC
ncbi:hypothetical protein NADE_008710 [Nannochloris sp. 'desiccata']|nr:hypothetical protein NADE_008710 [Chlorella desiccata (nom. nud.)]